MRNALAAVLGGAALALAGCASMELPFVLPWQDEPFTGRYRVADPKDRAVIEISPMAPGRWAMRYDDRNAGHGGGDLVAATRAELKAWLADDRQAESIRCLATEGRNAHPVVCSVPKDVPLTFQRKGASGRGGASRTGWILVAPTPAGLAFGDLVRER